MIGRFERFSMIITDISRYWHKIASDEMAKYGLRGAQAIYLVTMYRHPEGLTATKLCEICGKDKSDVSRAMASMQEKGLAARLSGETNYRAKMVLTEAGRAAAEHIRERARIAEENAGEGISPSDREIFYRTLSVIAENLKSISEDGLPK